MDRVSKVQTHLSPSSTSPASSIPTVPDSATGTTTTSTHSEHYMPKQAYLLQTGMGVDLHGADDTTAARRAIKNAIQHNNLLFLKHAGLKSLDQLSVEVTIACPSPDDVDRERVSAELPVGSVSVEVQKGGLLIDSDETGDPVCIAIAAVQVSIDR